MEHTTCHRLRDVPYDRSHQVSRDGGLLEGGKLGPRRRPTHNTIGVGTEDGHTHRGGPSAHFDGRDLHLERAIDNVDLFLTHTTGQLEVDLLF